MKKISIKNSKHKAANKVMIGIDCSRTKDDYNMSLREDRTSFLSSQTIALAQICTRLGSFVEDDPTQNVL